MKNFLFVLLVMFFLVLVGEAFAADPKIEMTPINPNLPQEIKEFYGAWIGVWETSVSRSPIGFGAKLVVENIDKEKATVLYIWETSSAWRVREGWDRYNASFVEKNGRIVLLIDRTEKKMSRMEFYIEEKTDLLVGTMFSAHVNYIKMKRLQLQ